MDDVTVSAARICAIGEVIPAEKPWLDPARPGAKKQDLGAAHTQKPAEAMWPVPTMSAEDRFADVSSIIAADGPDWDYMRLVDMNGPTIVIAWHDGGKSLYALDTDETAEQVVEHLRRQRGA